MPIRLRTTSLILGLLVLAGAMTSQANQAADDKEAIEIRRGLDKQVENWNKKDLDAFLQFYWKSPDVVFQSGGTRSDGFEAMRTRYQMRYKAEGKEMGTLAFSGVEVIMLSQESALVRGRWKLTLADGKTPGGLFTLVVRKLKEGWRIVHDHTSS